VSPRLTSIHRFPVKSLRGESLEQAQVEPWGLLGDRRWMLVDDDGVAITAREVNAMLLLRPEITVDGLRVAAPDLPLLETSIPDPGTQVPVSVFDSHFTAAPAGAEADAWFTKALDRPARLVHLDDPGRRPTDPDFSEASDRVSFADGFPLLLATEESLAALNDTVVEGARTGGEPLPMTRFRPNLVVAGVEPWSEDDWRRIRIGEAVFRAVKGCARCVITTIDPESAQRGKEPIASLAAVRRWDGATWFAINLVPDSPGATVRVGDDLEVLEAAAPGGGPLRPDRTRRAQA
jgi:MOSC domain-containing protein